MRLGVVLDLDGVLVDTERLYATLFAEIAGAHGIGLPPGTYGSLIGLARADRAARLKQMTDDADRVEACLDAYAAAKRKRLSRPIGLRPGAAAFLAWSASRRVPVAIATSASRRTAEAALQAAGLSGFRLPLVTRDEAAPKPAPASHTRAASLLGLPPHACYGVEDTMHGLRSAKSAGLRTVLIPDLVAPDSAMRRLATIVLPDLSALRTILSGALARPIFNPARLALSA